MGASIKRLTGADRRSAIVVLAATLVACGGDGSGPSVNATQPTTCSIVAQNTFVYEAMQDIYLWNDDLPVVDPAEFPSPEALLDALRVPQDRFSFITTTAADTAFFGAGQFVGLGFRTIQKASDELRVLDVFEGSVADNGGLTRGDFILAVNGRPIEEVLAEEGFSASLGPAEVGVVVELTWQMPGGPVETAEFVKDVVTIPPVSAVEVLDSATGPVGYLLFRNFVETAVADLNDAFAMFQAAGVRQVVMDLRYNSGGLLSVAEHLANLMGGETADGQVFYSIEYNDDNTFRNQTVLFRNLVRSLDLDQMIFVTTGSTASASEMVINGLEPFFNVVLVGARTFGKPVGQVAVRFCDQTLRPVSFRTVNADGTADFFEGFPADCAAEDDIESALGDPAEASLAESLFHLENGVCSTAASSARSALAEKPRSGRWRLLTAH